MNSSRFFQKFRRITYSTDYLPQIDGLRFLAIFSVVVVMHITHYLDEKFYGDQLITDPYWRNFAMEGGNGVALFFIISGFILSLPFARWRLLGEKKIALKYYYLRRITRLEPPYVVALLLLFIGHVWVLGKYPFAELFPHLVASIFYVHGLIYHSFSWVMPVAWSLEVEVQFYILAPLFCFLYLIPSRYLRWAIALLVIIVSAVAWFDLWRVGHVFMYLQYFFSGILLADLYCCNIRLIKNNTAGWIIGLLCLAGYFFIPSIHNETGYLVKIGCMFLLVHLVLSNVVMRRMFSVEGIVLIGGMCYSIYLLHFAIISFTGKALMQSGISTGSQKLFIPFLLLLTAVVLVLSSVYFLLVEKPFMRPRGLAKKPPAGIPSPDPVRSVQG